MAAGAGLQGSRTLYGFSGSASHAHQVSSPAHHVPLPAAVYATDHNIAYDDIELQELLIKGTLQDGKIYSKCTILLGSCKEDQA